MHNLYQGDCLEVMKEIPDKSIDLVLTDPPYGITACKWDTVIDLDLMWAQLKRIIKPKGAIVLTASQPFTTRLISSNYKMFRCEWIWFKNRGSNFASLKYHPFKEHESVVVFGLSKTTYNPIMQERSPSGKARTKYKFRNELGGGAALGSIDFPPGYWEIDKDLRNPSSVQKFNTQVGLHPTQKPVALMEYMIRTYTNKFETVLDFTMGSGTTGVAARNLARYFIGIELDAGYCEIARDRIENA